MALADTEYPSCPKHEACMVPLSLELPESATFLLDIAGVTADTTVTSATFSFGTTEGADLVPGTTLVPEPGSLLLLATGLLGMVSVRRKRSGGLSNR